MQLNTDRYPDRGWCCFEELLSSHIYTYIAIVPGALPALLFTRKGWDHRPTRYGQIPEESMALSEGILFYFSSVSEQTLCTNSVVMMDSPCNYTRSSEHCSAGYGQIPEEMMVLLPESFVLLFFCMQAKPLYHVCF